MTVEFVFELRVRKVFSHLDAPFFTTIGIMLPFHILCDPGHLLHGLLPVFQLQFRFVNYAQASLGIPLGSAQSIQGFQHSLIDALMQNEIHELQGLAAEAFLSVFGFGFEQERHITSKARFVHPGAGAA